MAKKPGRKKRIAAFVSMVLIAGMLTTGTWAWNSLHQTALNEVAAGNAGGRLHDDFSGVDLECTGKKVKQIYVENFGSDPILARIRIKEYLEVGEGAGLSVYKESTQRTNEGEIFSTIGGGEANDPTTWTTYKYEDVFNEQGAVNDNPIREFFRIRTGNPMQGVTPIQRYYMPTFNRSLKSFESDINGTFIDAKKDTYGANSRYWNTQDYLPSPIQYSESNQLYTNFIEYKSGSKVSGVEIVDPEEDYSGNDLVAGVQIRKTSGGAVLGESEVISMEDDTLNKYKVVIDPANNNLPKNAIHEAEPITVTQQTPTGKGIIKLSVWKDQWNHDQADILAKRTALTQAQENNADAQTIEELRVALKEAQKNVIGDFWIYDDSADGDGWAYWANPIGSKSTTGMLINGINMVTEPEGKWYYAMDVEGQFATFDDMVREDTDNNEFYFYDQKTGQGSKINTNAKEFLEILAQQTGNELSITGSPVSVEVSAGSTTNVVPGHTYKIKTIVKDAAGKIIKPDFYKTEWTIAPAQYQDKVTISAKGKLVISDQLDAASANPTPLQITAKVIVRKEPDSGLEIQATSQTPLSLIIVPEG